MVALLWTTFICPLEAEAAATMNTEIEYNIVLDEDDTYRWNANGTATKGNVIHLDDVLYSSKT